MIIISNDPILILIINSNQPYKIQIEGKAIRKITNFM